MVRIGLQIPSFTFPGVPPERRFPHLADVARTAEASGFDTVFVMDHFWQLPQVGAAHEPMFEAYTVLGALAASTSTVRLGTLVTGVTYRNPALLAKAVTTLDVVSGGRALLGIGAAWFEEEHRAMGVRFPPVRERFERLDDALRICRAMFREERATVAGTHHSIDGMWNAPMPLTTGGPPVLVGGTGERRTLRLVAEHADLANVNSSFAELGHKLEVLERHCQDVGRDRGAIGVSCLGTLVVAADDAAARAKAAQLLTTRGADASILDDAETFRRVLPRMIVGGPEEVVEQVRALRSVGLDGVVFNLPDVHDLETVALAGQVLAEAS